MGFVFNKDYGDHEQVREWMPAFASLRTEMEASGQYPYNDLFRGKIPGIEGDDEDTAIYLLQGLYRIERERDQVARLRSDGFETLEALDRPTRYAMVVLWREGYYVGGTGEIVAVKDARVIPDETGKPFAVLPKGKRTRGHRVGSAQVLVVK